MTALLLSLVLLAGSCALVGIGYHCRRWRALEPPADVMSEAWRVQANYPEIVIWRKR